MKFKWDENKRRENIRRRGIDFVGCEAIFEGETFTFEDQRFSYREQRLNKNSTSKTRSTRKSQTDWKRVEAMHDKDIDSTDVPEITPEQFARAILRKGLKPVSKKKQLTLRIDEDVLDWFKSFGNGYQSRMNAVLRAYVDANEQSKD